MCVGLSGVCVEDLLDGDGLGQVPWAVHVAAPQDGQVVGQQLEVLNIKTQKLLRTRNLFLLKP